jgi:4-hydroxysphinganine ceramide fatty acyl 2-hydroxylase
MATNASPKPKNKGTKTLFKNPVLDKLTRTHIAVPISILMIFSIVLLYWAFAKTDLTASSIIGIFIGGWLLLSFIEYATHRYLFHMETGKEWKSKMQYTIHGVHHEYPKDKERLAMPPYLSLALGFLFLWLTGLLMGDYSYPFVAGMAVGYSSYLFVHYIVHAYAPPKNAFKILWVHHAIHHYKQPDRAYGVSSPLWDFLLGTMPRKEKKS